MNHLKFRSIQIILLFIFSSIISYTALASEERHIHLNGEHLDPQNILLLDQIAGNFVDDGFYWLNTQTGQWGYEGNAQVQGVLASIANQNNGQATPEYNEYNESADRYNTWEGSSSTGNVTSGRVNGKNCTYVTVSGMTMKSCD